MKKIVILILFVLLLSGCAGLGFYKQATLMPDEFWMGGESNHDNEYSGKWNFGFKWKLK